MGWLVTGLIKWLVDAPVNGLWTGLQPGLHVKWWFTWPMGPPVYWLEDGVKDWQSSGWGIGDRLVGNEVGEQACSMARKMRNASIAKLEIEGRLHVPPCLTTVGLSIPQARKSRHDLASNTKAPLLMNHLNHVDWNHSD